MFEHSYYIEIKDKNNYKDYVMKRKSKFLNKSPWWGVIKDTENKKISIIGPIFNDNQMITIVNEKINSGMHFNCETIETFQMSDEEIADYWKQQGYKQIDTFELVGHDL